MEEKRWVSNTTAPALLCRSHRANASSWMGVRKEPDALGWQGAAGWDRLGKGNTTVRGFASHPELGWAF